MPDFSDTERRLIQLLEVESKFLIRIFSRKYLVIPNNSCIFAADLQL